MTIYNEVRAKLEAHPDFRERRFRAEKLSILALRKLGLESKYYVFKQPLSVDEMISFAKKYDSYRHEWDAVMRANPQLQGNDYEDGKALAQKAQIEFGYEPNYYQNQETLKTI